MNRRFSIRPSDVADAHLVERLVDAPVGALGHLLERQAVLDALDGAGDGRGDALDAALDGVLEHGDVALPAGGPLDSLAGDALLGAGQHHVEGQEATDAGAGKAKDLRGAGGGDADGHFGLVKE